MKSSKYLSQLSVSVGVLLLVLFSRNCKGQDYRNVASLAHQCNATVRDGQGILVSPNFPLLYDPNSFCKWQVTVEEDWVIKLSFRHFELERSPGCAYDKVMVYNGPSNTYPLLGKFCGPFRPTDVITTSNRMLVTFQSDLTNGRSGFFAIFLSMAPQVAGPNSCGGLFTEASGTFHSVNFPKSNYPNGMTCVWHIRAPEGHEVVLQFKKLTLEVSANCKYDSITVFSGQSTGVETIFLGRFCKLVDVPDEVVSNGNEMFVTFAADSSGNDVGFSASYITRTSSLPKRNVTAKTEDQSTGSDDICSGVQDMRGASGVIISPGYKRKRGYPPNLRCSWRITTSPNTMITLRFINMEMEYDDQCLFDSVTVYTGRSESGSVIGKYCGTMEDQVVQSSTNEMFIVFATDSGGQHPGFKAVFRETEATTLSAVITSTFQPVTVHETARSTRSRDLTTTALTPTSNESISSCSDSCVAPLVSNFVCSSAFAAAVKVLSVEDFESGVTRLRVALVKMLKLEIAGVPNAKKSKFWIDVTCPGCFPTLEKRSRYIIAGMQLERLGGEITQSDYIQLFTKNLQKSWRKEIKRCGKIRKQKQ